jgi:hypothetical protein
VIAHHLSELFVTGSGEDDYRHVRKPFRDMEGLQLKIMIMAGKLPWLDRSPRFPSVKKWATPAWQHLGVS